MQSSVPITPPTTAPASCGAENRSDDAKLSGRPIAVWPGVTMLLRAKSLGVRNVDELAVELADEDEELVVADSVVVVMVESGLELPLVISGAAAVRSIGRQLSWRGCAKKYAGEFIGYAVAG